MHPASQRQSERSSLDLAVSFSFCLFLYLYLSLFLVPLSLTLSLSISPSTALRPSSPLPAAVLLPPSASSFPSVPPRSLHCLPHSPHVSTVLRRFLFFPLSVSFYWQQPPTPSRFYTGKSIQPYVRLAGASAVLVHGFRNLLQLDGISGVIVRRR